MSPPSPHLLGRCGWEKEKWGQAGATEPVRLVHINNSNYNCNNSNNNNNNISNKTYNNSNNSSDNTVITTV